MSAGQAAKIDSGQRIGGLEMPTPVEVRAASLNWAFSSAKARAELGWRPSPHEDCLEETIDYLRAHEGRALGPVGARQPLPLRFAAGTLRRAGLGR